MAIMMMCTNGDQKKLEIFVVMKNILYRICSSPLKGI